ncbi:trypsin-like peptidase domain-containing protein [Dactylosporangium sp. NPDC000244]|uniref:trypsin-like peptidase domain-containing protein n=1 Tax=Dactylosporangium sp. NPDC000244 TaxID=3154365 RepID=UPI00332BD0ED
MVHDVHSRVVEVLRTGTSTGRGSGYAVTVDLVLTAAHVVADDTDVCVVAGNEELSATVVWRDKILDAALVRVPAQPWNGIGTCWATLSGARRVGCTAIGYPRVQKTSDGMRVEEHIEGFIMPATGRRIGRYAVNVTSALPHERTRADSPWAGMSGAAVLTDDGSQILGVLTDDPTGFQSSRLEAVPVAALLNIPSFAELIGADPTALVTLPEHFDRQPAPLSAGTSPAQLKSHAIQRSGWLMRGAAGADTRQHFAFRARGQRSRVLSADLFRGRAAAVAAVTGWLTAAQPPGRPMVVTGLPGVGKSAVLGRAVLALEAEDRWCGVAVHAHAAAAADVVSAIAAAIGIADTADVDLLIDALDHDDDVPPFMLAVDALDEANTLTDQNLIIELLNDLARLPNVRVAVATRRMAVDDRFGVGRLPAALGVTSLDSPNLVDLDSDAFFDPDGLQAFARAVLTQEGMRRPAPGDAAWTAYRAHPALADRVAAAVAHAADRNYLVAALTATHLSSQDAIVDPAAPGFREDAIPTTVEEAVSKYLDHEAIERRARIRGLLTALAYARGGGLDDHQWMIFSARLGYPVGQVDLDALRDSPAADYLLHTGAADRGRVTRLFHQALVDDLLRRRGNRPSDERALFEALLPPAGVAWPDVDPYTRSHIAEHAVAAGSLPRLLHDEHYLSVADLDRLLPLLPGRPEPPDAEIISVLRTASHWIRALPPNRRAALLSLTAARLGMSDLCQRFNLAGGQYFSVAWAHSLGAAHQVIDTGPIASVAIGRLTHARDVLVAGQLDGTVRLWNPATGQPVGHPLKGHSRPVSTMTLGRLADGRDILNTSDDSGNVHLWDLGTGRRIDDRFKGRLRHTHEVTLGQLGNGSDILAAITEGGTVQLWDPATGQHMNDLLTDDAASVWALAIGRLGDGRDVLATAGMNGDIQLWDPITGQAIGEALIGHAGAVEVLTFSHLCNGRIILASAGRNSGVIQIWDTHSRQLSAVLLTDHSDALRTLVCGRLGESRDVLVTHGENGIVRLWDAGTGQSIEDPLTTHPVRVSAAALGRLTGGRDILAAAGVDGIVRLWDLGTEQLGTDRLPGHIASVGATVFGQLRDGRNVLATSGNDGTIRLWDPATGRPVGNALTGHTDPIHAIALGGLGDREILAVNTDNDGTVQLWEIATGQPVGLLLTGHRGWTTALALGRLRDGRDLLATAGLDGVVRMWDLGTGVQIADSPNSHTNLVRGMVLGRLCDDRDILITGSFDGTVQIWDPATGQPDGEPIVRLAIPVCAVALGRLGGRDILAIGRNDGEVWLWDPAARRPVGDPLTGHSAPVHAVAFGRLGDRDILATGGIDSTVHLWHLTPSLQKAAVLDVATPVSGLVVCDHGVGIASGTGLSMWMATSVHAGWPTAAAPERLL